MKRDPQLANIYECTGCLACIDGCPTDALSLTENNEGHFFYQINTEKCIKCYKCEQICPTVSHMNYGNNNFKSSDLYASWSINNSLRKKSASGGVFASIASYILDNNGIVIGATMDGIQCKHIEIINKVELEKIQGSKYVQSNTLGVYNLVKKRLQEGKTVLFSGVGCQVAGLLSFIKNSKLKENLITVDMVCGGVPSNFLIKQYSQFHNIKTIISFRNKNNGWKSFGYKYQLTYINKNGNIIIDNNKKNLIIDGFSSGLTNRYSCNNCKFAYAHRISDFTIADLWGDKKYPQEHFNGISSIAVHTHKGKDLITQLNKYLITYPLKWEDILPYNPRYIYGRTQYSYRPERFFLAWIFKHMSYNTICKIYASENINYYNFFWMTYKAIKKLLACYETLNKRRHIKQLLKNNLLKKK